MSDESKGSTAELRELVRMLSLLLDDAHPGLITWQLAVKTRIEQIGEYAGLPRSEQESRTMISYDRSDEVARELLRTLGLFTTADHVQVVTSALRAFAREQGGVIEAELIESREHVARLQSTLNHEREMCLKDERAKEQWTRAEAAIAELAEWRQVAREAQPWLENFYSRNNEMWKSALITQYTVVADKFRALLDRVKAAPHE